MIGLVVATLASGCTDPFAAAKEALRHSMKDPDATQFREVAWCGKEGGPIEGEFNAKNSYGAYAGFERFYYADYSVGSDFGDPVYQRLFKLCMKESARHTAERAGKPFDEKAKDAELNAIFVPDNVSAMVDAPSPPPPEQPIEPQVAAPDTDPAVDDDGEVPVCDRPNSAEKSALMNEVGTDCLGE